MLFHFFKKRGCYLNRAARVVSSAQPEVGPSARGPLPHSSHPRLTRAGDYRVARAYRRRGAADAPLTASRGMSGCCPGAPPLHFAPARPAFLLASSRSRAAAGPPPPRAAVATSSAMACCWPAPPWHAAVVALARIRSRARIATAPLSRSPACAASHRHRCRRSSASRARRPSRARHQLRSFL
jgi:hypothetical protein